MRAGMFGTRLREAIQAEMMMPFPLQVILLAAGHGQASRGRQRSQTQVETLVDMETMVTLRLTMMRHILMKHIQEVYLMPITGTDLKMVGHRHIKTEGLDPLIAPFLKIGNVLCCPVTFMMEI